MQPVDVPIAEVAAAMRVTEARVYQLIASRAIPAVRGPGRRVRVPRAAFEAWLRSQEQRALENLREPLDADSSMLRPDEVGQLVKMSDAR